MSVRLHITPVYQVEYGDTISSKLTDNIIDLVKDSETGWISEDEYELEIDKEELKDILNNKTETKTEKTKETKTESVKKESTNKSNNKSKAVTKKYKYK